MATALLDDELWRLVEPLLPVRERRFHHPGHRGSPGSRLPQELGYGSGMTCWRRLKEWQQAGVFQALHERLLAELRAAGRLDLSRAVCGTFPRIYGVLYRTHTPQFHRFRLVQEGRAP